MTLQAKLDEIKAGFKAKVDQSDILEGILGSDDRIPDFTLAAAGGGQISSRDLLASGKLLVITFYRGVW
jgi:hypothetical protein